jgi:hypothetical protein
MHAGIFKWMEMFICACNQWSIIKTGASFKKRGRIAHYFFERNRIWFIYKYFPWPSIFSHLPWIIFQEMISVGLHFLKKNGRMNYLKARIHGIMGMWRYSSIRKEYTTKFQNYKIIYNMYQKKKIIPLSVLSKIERL